MKHELRMLYSTQEQSNHGKRNTALDMARGLAIILIVIGHCSYVGGVPAVWLSTFHLPAFFLLSGWLSAEKTLGKEKIKTLLFRKASSVLVPYLWFSAGSLVLDLIQVFRGSFTWDMLWGHLMETISLQGYSVMWFLPVFFLTQIMIDLTGQGLNKANVKGGMVHVVSAIGFSALAILFYVLYHGVISKILPAFLVAEIRIVIKAVIGAAFCSYGALAAVTVKGIVKKGKKAGAGLLVAGLVLMAVNVIASFRCGHMDLNNLNVGFLPYYFILGTTGSIGMILVYMKLPNIPLLTFYGQNSLIIMCTHLNFYVMYLAIRITDIIAAPFTDFWHPLWIVCMLVITMLLEIPVILLIRVCFPFVLGRARAHRAVSLKEK